MPDGQSEPDKEELKNALGKRLILIDKFIVTLFIIVALTSLQALSASELSSDTRALAQIAEVNQIDLRSAVQDGTLNVALSEVLAELDMHLSDLQRAVRKTLTDILTDKYAIQPENIARVKGRADSPDRFSVIDMDVSDDLLNSSVPPATHTVNQYIDRFCELLASRALFVASELQKESIFTVSVRAEDNSGSVLETVPDFGCRFPNLMHVALRHSQIRATVGEDLAALGPFDQGPQCSETVYTLDVETTRLDGTAETSIYALIGGSRDSDMDVLTLGKSDDELARLRRLYGNIQYATAQEIVARDYGGAYGNVAIFGFTFRKAHYALAVAVLYAVLMYFTARTNKIARDEELRAITEVQDPNVLDELLNSMIGRVVLWCAIPLLAAAGVALSVWPWTESTHQALYWLMVLITLCCGVASCYLSRGL